jgi:hypothetical protein
VDGAQVGQGLGGEPAPGGAGRQLVIHGPHRGPPLRQIQADERWEQYARGVEPERLGGDPSDQPRLQEDVEGV